MKYTLEAVENGWILGLEGDMLIQKTDKGIEPIMPLSWKAFYPSLEKALDSIAERNKIQRVQEKT